MILFLGLHYLLLLWTEINHLLLDETVGQVSLVLAILVVDAVIMVLGSIKCILFGLVLAVFIFALWVLLFFQLLELIPKKHFED